jgi:hypothetical protein
VNIIMNRFKCLINYRHHQQLVRCPCVQLLSLQHPLIPSQPTTLPHCRITTKTLLGFHSYSTLGFKIPTSPWNFQSLLTHQTRLVTIFNWRGRFCVPQKVKTENHSRQIRSSNLESVKITESFFVTHSMNQIKTCLT